MQVSATLIAAQQAAREARARLQIPQAQAAQAPQFAAALAQSDGFSALPLKQTAAPQASMATTQAPAPNPTAKLGQHINILV